MIPVETQCGIYTVVTTPVIGLVSIVKQGLLVREHEKSFNVGEDGETLQECYDKAIAEAASM